MKLANKVACVKLLVEVLKKDDTFNLVKVLNLTDQWLEKLIKVI